jgi:hypothetical protein
MSDVIISVRGDIASVDTNDLPNYFTVVIRDYNRTNVAPERIKVDELGCEYVEYIHKNKLYIGTVQGCFKSNKNRQAMTLFVPVNASDQYMAEQKIVEYFDNNIDFNMIQIVSIVEKT